MVSGRRTPLSSICAQPLFSAKQRSPTPLLLFLRHRADGDPRRCAIDRSTRFLDQAGYIPWGIGACTRVIAAFSRPTTGCTGPVRRSSA